MVDGQVDDLLWRVATPLLGTGRTCSFSPAAAVTFTVAFAPLSLVTRDPATVLFRIFFLLAVADRRS